MSYVESAFLCQSAMVHEGLFSALGIGIENVTVPQFPSIVAVTAVAVVRWDRTEEGEAHVVVISVGLEGETVARAEIPAQAPVAQPGQHAGTNVFHAFAFDARRSGAYQVAVSVDGVEQRSLPLRIDAGMPAL